MLNHPRADVQFALRSMRKTPLFTGTAIPSCALGTGANTAIFTLVDRVLLRTLPVKEPERLVAAALAAGYIRASEAASMYPMRVPRYE